MKILFLATAAMALGAVACKSKAESDHETAVIQQDSAVRLRTDSLRACALASLQTQPDAVVKARAECDIATRNLNRFLSGK